MDGISLKKYPPILSILPILFFSQIARLDPPHKGVRMRRAVRSKNHCYFRNVRSLPREKGKAILSLMS